MQALIEAGTGAEIQAMLDLHGLAGSAAAVAYFSFADSALSFIGAHDPDGTITPLIEFLPLPVRGGELLEEIAAIDENAATLLNNYRTQFSDIFKRVLNFGVEHEPERSGSLRWLLSACSLVLWLEEEDVARALAPSADGVRADTVVIEADGRFLLDGRRLLRSLMSYRLAGVPGHVLARSAFESLGDFAADAIRQLSRQWKVDGVVCAGDLFERNVILRERTRRGLTRLRVPVRFPAEGGR